jgi:hypothetical protein
MGQGVSLKKHSIQNNSVAQVIKKFPVVDWNRKYIALSIRTRTSMLSSHFVEIILFTHWVVQVHTCFLGSALSCRLVDCFKSAVPLSLGCRFFRLPVSARSLHVWNKINVR